MLSGKIFDNRVLQDYVDKDPRTMMLVWDTGASYGSNPLLSDFIDYVKCDITVMDVTKTNIINGIDTDLHKAVNIKGNDIFIPCISYHLTQTDTCLFLPHTYH